jgi:DNA-binding ferritin-like protein (Dps family)
MKTKEMIALNNQRREQLNPVNLEAYENAMVYVRLNARSEYATESVLLEILEHLIEAQQHGKTATEVFGEDIRSYCDTLIANVPPQSKLSWVLDILNYSFTGLGTVFAVQSLFQFLALFIPSLRIEKMSLVPLLVFVVLNALVILLLLTTMKLSIFKANKAPFLLVGGAFGLSIAAYAFSTVLFKDVWTVPMNLWTNLIVTILLLGLSRVFKRISEQADQSGTIA